MTNANRSETVNPISLRNELFGESLKKIASRPAERVYSDGETTFSPIPAFAKALGAQDIEKVFGTEPFDGKLPKGLATMFEAAKVQPTLLLIVKDLVGDLTFRTHREFSTVERKQQRAVEGKGVDGLESVLETASIDQLEVDPFETANALRGVLDDIYQPLNAVYQAALAALGYKVEQLPYASEDVDGEWIGALSFDEARGMIERRRAKSLERRRDEAKLALDAVLSVSL